MGIKYQHKGDLGESPVRSHWESVYERKSPEEVSWFQPSPETSLRLIETAGMQRTDAVIDVGGGASTLADELLAGDFSDITVLDISAASIETDRVRLGPQADKISWIIGDVLQFRPERTWDLWHDRACFHFMTTVEQRQKYLQALERSVGAGGACIIATFAPDGPRRCSGLDVVQYDAERLLGTFGKHWQLEKQLHELHSTPSDSNQSFNYFLLRRA